MKHEEEIKQEILGITKKIEESKLHTVVKEFKVEIKEEILRIDRKIINSNKNI